MSDEKYFAVIADEIEYNRCDRVLWTRALGESGGDADKTKAAYIRLRLAELRKTAAVSPSGSDSAIPSAGAASPQDNRLVLLRADLADALQAKKKTSFYSVIKATPEATDTELTDAIAAYQARIDSGATVATPEFKYAKETLGNPRSRETYDRRLFAQINSDASDNIRSRRSQRDHQPHSDNAILAMWDSRKSSVIVGAIALAVVGYMLLGFYKEREASANRKKALDAHMLETRKTLDVATMYADTDRTRVEGSLQNDQQRIATQGQLANRVIAIQESAESRQSRQLEYQANATAEALRQQEERIKIASDQLAWERKQREQDAAVRQSQASVASDRMAAIRIMVTDGRFAEARAYARTANEVAVISSAESADFARRRAQERAQNSINGAYRTSSR